MIREKINIRRKDLEHVAQTELIYICRMYEYKYPSLKGLFAIPNGGARHIGTARKLKAEGVMAGVPDLFLPVPAGHYHGFFIEMKIKPNRPTAAQVEVMANLRLSDYKVEVCYSAEAAWGIIKKYLEEGK